MNSSETLFVPGEEGEELDPAYVHVRDSEFCAEDREYLDAAWARYKPYGDRNFATEFRKRWNFQCRAWELRLASTFWNMGLSFQAPKPGPDFKFTASGSFIFVEAVAPQATESLLENYELAGTQGASVPDDEMVLRYTSVIDEKLRKYAGYRARGTVADRDAYVIAISGANIPQSSLEAGSFPRILKPLFALGSLYFSVPIGGTGDITTGIQRQIERTTIKGSPVSCGLFLAEGRREISGILFAPHHIKNRPESWGKPAGNDFVFVHNPFAFNPVPIGFFPRGQEWGGKDGSLVTLNDWRPSEAA